MYMKCSNKVENNVLESTGDLSLPLALALALSRSLFLSPSLPLAS